MTIQECYHQLEGNYEEALSRLQLGTLVQKFALRFLDDHSFQDLAAALEAGNVSDAFRAAHTLKGVCANLSFTRLQSSASTITETLRAGDLETAQAQFPGVAADYAMTITALRQFG